MNSHWMFNCEKVSKRFSKSLDTPAPFLERMGLAFHFMMCRYCDRYRKQLLFMKKLMQLSREHAAEDVTLVPLPPEARNRIKRAVATHTKE